MIALNFPAFTFRCQEIADKKYIFDGIRKKFVVLTPEEWVRQHVVAYLLQVKKISKSLISLEKKVVINGLIKRYDIVVYNSEGSIFLLVECKEPKVKITQETFDQIARYNLSLKADYLMVTNGLHHVFCKLDYLEKKYHFLNDLPI